MAKSNSYLGFNYNNDADHYIIGELSYNSKTLRLEGQKSDDIYPLHDISKLTEHALSIPVMINTKKQGYVIVCEDNNILKILAVDEDSSGLYDPIKNWSILPLPDLSKYIPNMSEIPKLNLPESTKLLTYLNSREDNMNIIEAGNEYFKEVYVYPSNMYITQLSTKPLYDEQIPKDFYRVLIGQLYGTPINTPNNITYMNKEYTYVPYNQLSGYILKSFSIEPLLQPYAGPPGSVNKLMIMNTLRGDIFTIGQYDSHKNQMLPPK